MNKYKICVYAICKNEAPFVDRWMDSMSEADMVVVTDTGSTDDTAEKLKNRGAVVYNENILPWRFDTARNISLKNVPEDVDICLCTDLDEVLNKGWRQCVEKVWTKETKFGKYLYNWSIKPDGTPDVQFLNLKIHCRKDIRWKYPVHEIIEYTGGNKPSALFIDNMVLNHYPDKTKSRSNYLSLLELAVKEYPKDDRCAYYLGREYMYQNQLQKCIDELKRHLSLPSAVWHEERCASMRFIAQSYFNLNKTEETYKWYNKAIAEMPYMREPYTEFALKAYILKDYTLLNHLVKEALKIKEKSKDYINMGYSWDYTLYDLGAISCYYLNLFEKSYEYAKIALEMAPENERLKSNLDLITEKLKTL